MRRLQALPPRVQALVSHELIMEGARSMAVAGGGGLSATLFKPEMAGALALGRALASALGGSAEGYALTLHAAARQTEVAFDPAEHLTQPANAPRLLYEALRGGKLGHAAAAAAPALFSDPPTTRGGAGAAAGADAGSAPAGAGSAPAAGGADADAGADVVSTVTSFLEAVQPPDALELTGEALSLLQQSALGLLRSEPRIRALTARMLAVFEADAACYAAGTGGDTDAGSSGSGAAGAGAEASAGESAEVDASRFCPKPPPIAETLDNMQHSTGQVRAALQALADPDRKPDAAYAMGMGMMDRDASAGEAEPEAGASLIDRDDTAASRLCNENAAYAMIAVAALVAWILTCEAAAASELLPTVH